MRRVTMAVLAVTVAGCQPVPPEVEDAWVRLPAVPGRPAAAYFTMEGGDLDATLVRVTTPGARRTELHETTPAGMRPIARVAIASGAEVAFAPGGRHVMLYDVAASVRPGGTVPLTFTYAEGGGEKTLLVDAQVVGAADPAPS